VKTISSIMTLALMVALTGGCDKMRGQSDKGEGGGSGATILVGEYGSFTGSQATFGHSTHNGVMLALKEINDAGGVKGKKLEVKNLDTAGKTQEAGLAVTRLITEDHVVAILGEVASSLSLAGGRVAQQKGVPMVSPSSTNPDVTDLGDMIFRVCFIDPFQGYVGAKFARDTLKAKKAAVLYDQANAYSQGLREEFKKNFTKLGGEIVTEQAFSEGDSDFSAQLSSIRDTAPDVIYVPGYYTEVGNIVLQARKLNVNQPFLGGDGWDSAQLAKIGGAAVDGNFYSNHYSPQDKRPAVQNFVKKYKEAYGEVPDGLAALGYDAALILADSMKRAASLSGKDLAKAIGETKDFPGVTGNISIDEHRNARKSAVVVTLKGGIPTYVTTIDPP
jgi:branched-chain amino acid transport system substrate-binding protein